MEEERVKELIKRHAESHDAKDMDAFMETVAEDATVFLPIVGRSLEGREAVRGFFEKAFMEMPDSKLTFERIIVSGDEAIVSWRETGTYKGKPIVNDEAVFFRVAGGQIQHIRVYHDVAAMAAQASRTFRFLYNRIRKKAGYEPV